MNKFHTPVLLKEVIEHLKVKENGRYIDATLGGGGHSREIINKGGIVLGIDQDQEALDFVSKDQDLSIKNKRLVVIQGNFKEIDRLAHLNNFDKVDGILFDLGVSSHQIDTSERGFSFLREGPLDMRMDKSSSVTADVLVNLLGKRELTEIFSKFGQERRAITVAREIVNTRKQQAIKTTGQLTEVIKKAYGIRGDLSDFTKNEINKRVFQALRIAVNNEFESLNEGLEKALGLLAKSGRLAVIAFHSLEDAIVKEKFEEFKMQNLGEIITDKPIMAQKEEIEINSRSKSAKLRVFMKN
jgi:16S rRNA (cytosine1402-N4)-methyltransferase